MRPEIHHRLDSENVPSLDLRPQPGTPVVRNLRIFVHTPANPVPDVVPHHRKPIRLGMLLHRPTNIAEVVPRPALLNRPFETFLSDPDQLESLVTDFPNGDGSRRIADISFQRRPAVNGKDVAFLQRVVRRKTVNDLVVD